MIDFSRIPRTSVFGKFLRGLLKFLPPTFVLPVVQGRLRGKKWTIGSGVFGYWLGTYDLQKQILLERVLKKGDVVFDIGAHAGFFSLLMSVLVCDHGQVFAFEPYEPNIRYLKAHMDKNKRTNVTIIQKVVTEQGGKVFFTAGDSSFGGHIDAEGGLQAQAVALDEEIKKKLLPPPNLIKIDVEGEEIKVLRGARFTIEKHRPLFLIAVHAPQNIRRREVIALLTPYGYMVKSIDSPCLDNAEELFAYPNEFKYPE